MDQALGLQQSNLVKMVPASLVPGVSQSQLHPSQGREEFPAILDEGLLQSTLRSEQGIYIKHTGHLALMWNIISCKNH